MIFDGYNIYHLSPESWNCLYWKPFRDSAHSVCFVFLISVTVGGVYSYFNRESHASCKIKWVPWWPSSCTHPSVNAYLHLLTAQSLEHFRIDIFTVYTNTHTLKRYNAQSHWEVGEKCGRRRYDNSYNMYDNTYILTICIYQ